MKQLAQTMQKLENMQTRLAKEIMAKKTQKEMESEEEKKKLVDMITQLRSDLRSGREEIKHPSRAGHKRRSEENDPREDSDTRRDRNDDRRRPPVSDRDDRRPTRPLRPRGRGGATAERPRERNEVRGRVWRRSNPDRCSVVKNFAFLKTHKTGSSTLTNLFHRYGYFHNLSFALPKDNLYYGYPRISKTIQSVHHVRPGDGFPYDVMTSAHAVFNEQVFSTIVGPEARLVTVMREPLSHFRSSWRYWGVHEVAKASANKFLENLDQYDTLPKLYGKTNLVLNSFAFDLGGHFKPNLQGPDREAVQSELESFIQNVEDKFQLVLITEFMDESLVLLKRLWCWNMSDILYLSSKVSTGSRLRMRRVYRPQSPYTEKVRQLNYADAALYDYFNATLWQRIEAEGEDFQKDLQEYQTAKRKVTKFCAQYNRPSEDYHRSQIELYMKGEIPFRDAQCHYMFLDSKGFSKQIKSELGYPYDLLECYAQLPMTAVVLIRSPSKTDLAMWAVMVHTSVRRKVQLITSSADMKFLEVHSDMETTRNKRKAKTAIGGPWGLRYKHDVYERMVRHGWFMVVLRHPVKEFLSMWHDEGLAEMLEKDQGRKVSIDEFLDLGGQKLRQRAKVLMMNKKDVDECSRLIQHRQSCRVGSNFDMDQLRFPFFAEYPLESITMLRHHVCWTVKDVRVYNEELLRSGGLQKSDVENLNATTVEAIIRFSQHDMEVYEFLNESFWDRIVYRPKFHYDMKMIQESHEELLRECEKGEGAPLECAIMEAKTEKDILEAREEEVLGATVKRIPIDHFVNSKIEGTQDRFKSWNS